jgi:serine/threonine-protein kinase
VADLGASPLAGLAAALADRYRIERELGQGGMATVYLAEDLKHHRKVAVKVLRPELAASLGAERFLREIEIAARLQHPHILALFDSGRTGSGPDDFLYYVMPYVEGETLRDRLNRSGRFAVADVVRYTTEIADALAKAHKAGVVHRDIKPENILLADGHALVMDFGVAKAVTEATGQGEMTTAGMSLGTPAYMAPEQVAADSRIDHRADLYALGLVAYEMLVGGSPYSATTPQQQMAAHITQPPAPISSRRPDCPPALAAVIMRCLEKNPGERWQTADEIVARLAVADLLTSRRGFPRLPVAAAGAAALLLLIAAAIGYRRMAHGGDGATPGDNSVGVMLFDNITRDTSYAYLSDGLASEIATTLARVPRLAVRSPGAVRSASRGMDPDPVEIGRRLNVQNVVEGEFQRAGDRIRISVRLVQVPSGTQRWNEAWTRPMTDLLSVQEEIAQAVAKAIAGQLLPEERSVLALRRTGNPEAYDHFLRGNFQLAHRTPDGTARAIEEYRAAVRLDSSFAQAEARIAEGYALYAEWGWDFPGVSADSQVALGFHAADRALALDSSLADGWMARGLLLYLRYPRTVDGAVEALKRATVLDSNNAEAWHQYGSQILILGRYQDAIAPTKRALALEPGRPITLENLGDLYDALHRYREGMVFHDSAIAVDPEFHVAYGTRSFGRLRLGDRAGARADAAAAMRFSPPGEQYYGLAPLAAVAAADGDTAKAHQLMDQALAPFKARKLGPLAAQMILYGLVATGQRTLALDWLERIEPRGVMLWWILQYPEVDAIRADPRFQRIIDQSSPPEAR